MTRARSVTHVAELVGLDASRRRVRTASGAPARLSNKEVVKVRLCWRIAGEANQRTRVYPRSDVALARRHHDELVAAKVDGTPTGADGFPLSDEEQARPAGRRHTFGTYLTEVYIPAHPDWGPKHRGNVTSMGGIIAELFVYPEGDTRGAQGDPIWLDAITSDDGARMILARRRQRRRQTATGDGAAIGARAEDAAWKLASAVFNHALNRTPPAVKANSMKAVGRRKANKEVRARAEVADAAWSSAEVDLVASCIDAHFAGLVLCRGRTALRPSEAAFIEPGDIDLDHLSLEARGSFHVETRKHNGGKRYRTGPLKHREVGDTRLVPIANHAPLAEALVAAVAVAPELNAQRRAEVHKLRVTAVTVGDVARVAWCDEELAELAVVRVFRNPDGSAIDWTTFDADYWMPALEKAFADAPGDDAATLTRKAQRRATTFYELRHMAEGIWFHELGVPLEEISRWVGTALPTLMKHYARRNAHAERTAWDRAVGGGADDSGSGVEVNEAVIDLAAHRNARRGGPSAG